MSKTVTPTVNDVVTAYNISKGKKLVRKIALVSAVTAVVSVVVITVANRMENEETVS